MHREVCLHSLGVFPITFKPRLFAIHLVESTAFKTIFVLIIFVNTVLLALQDPVVASNPLNAINNESELFFLVAFSLETVLKMFAYGVWWEGKGTYLKTPWDVFDFLLVTVGWVAWGVDDLNTSIVSSLRLFRLMRPLRAVKVVPALGWLVGTIMKSGEQFLAAGFLIFLLFTIFSFASMIFWRGKLRQRCVDIATGVEVLDANTFCSTDPDADSGFRCPPGSKCTLVGYNPNRNVTSFDNFGASSLVLFEIMSMEGWSSTMMWVSDAAGVSSQIYFTLSVVVFALIAVNVFIAIVAVNVTTQRQLQNDASEAKKAAKAVRENIASRVRAGDPLVESMGGQRDDPQQDVNNEGGGVKPPDLDQIEKDLIQFKHRLDLFNKRYGVSLLDGVEMRLILSYERMRKAPGYAVVTRESYTRLIDKHKGVYLRWRRRAIPIIDHYEKIAARRRHLAFGRTGNNNNNNNNEVASPAPVFSSASAVPPLAFYDHRLSVTLGTPRPVGLSTEAGEFGGEKDDIEKQQRENPPPPVSPRPSTTAAPLSPQRIEATMRLEVMNRDLFRRGESSSTLGPNVFMRADEYVSSRLKEAMARAEARRAAYEDDVLGAKPGAPAWRRVAYRLVTSRWFEPAMIFIIVANIAALAAYRFDQPPEVTAALEAVYVAFWAMFAAEMAVKMAAVGLPCYACNPWTAFDGLVVLFGLLEFVVPKSSENVTTVLRSFRLLRVLRVFTFVRELRDLLEVTLATLKTILPFTLIVFAYLYVVAIMGMMLFGGRFEADPSEYDCSPEYVHYPENHCPPRTHYDTFAWAFITSFQVLISDGWNVINYRAVAATNAGAAVYFVFVAVIANSVLLNLYLGILIDSFLTISEGKKLVEFRKRVSKTTAGGAAADDEPEDDPALQPWPIPREEAEMAAVVVDAEADAEAEVVVQVHQQRQKKEEGEVAVVVPPADAA